MCLCLYLEKCKCVNMYIYLCVYMWQQQFIQINWLIDRRCPLQIQTHWLSSWLIDLLINWLIDYSVPPFSKCLHILYTVYIFYFILFYFSTQFIYHNSIMQQSFMPNKTLTFQTFNRLIQQWKVQKWNIKHGHLNFWNQLKNISQNWQKKKYKFKYI